MLNLPDIVSVYPVRVVSTENLFEVHIRIPENQRKLIDTWMVYWNSVTGDKF